MSKWSHHRLKRCAIAEDSVSFNDKRCPLHPAFIGLFPCGGVHIYSSYPKMQLWFVKVSYLSHPEVNLLLSIPANFITVPEYMHYTLSHPRIIIIIAMIIINYSSLVLIIIVIALQVVLYL